jgi:hypothetical protein
VWKSDAVVAHRHEPEPVVDGKVSSDVVGEQHLASVRASHHARELMYREGDVAVTAR